MTDQTNRIDRDKILDRIRALRAKTTGNGCTEEEALAAAEKIAALLEKYSLSLSDAEMSVADCIADRTEGDDAYRSPLSTCAPAIAYFTDTKVWREVRMDPARPRREAKRERAVFFGLAPDVEVAVYLYSLIRRALFREGSAYECRIVSLRAAVRRSMIRDFQLGMAARLVERLHEMKDALRAETRRDTGRDLMVVKGDIVERDYAALGLHLGKCRASRRAVNPIAFSAGVDAAEDVSIVPGVRSGVDPVPMLGGAR